MLSYFFMSLPHNLLTSYIHNATIVPHQRAFQDFFFLPKLGKENNCQEEMCQDHTSAQKQFGFILGKCNFDVEDLSLKNRASAPTGRVVCSIYVVLPLTF